MTRRPDPFNQPKLEDALREVGCPDSFVSSTVSNYRLFVPLLFIALGEDRVFDLVDPARTELGLGEQESAWRSSAKYLVAWARAAIEDYKARRIVMLATAPPKAQDDDRQPRLL
jgi:hypothetical protein